MDERLTTIKGIGPGRENNCISWELPMLHPY